MRRLLLFLPLLVDIGYCQSSFFENGGRFLAAEHEALIDRRTSVLNKSNRTIIATPLNDALFRIVFETVGNMFISQEEMIGKLADQGIKEGTEEFYAILEVRRILKDLDTWIEEHGLNAYKHTSYWKSTAYQLRWAILEIVNKRMVCNKYTDSINYIRDTIGEDLFENSFKVTIMAQIESLFFSCSKMIDILQLWTNSLIQEPAQSRVGRYVRNLGYLEQYLYTTLIDYAAERDFVNTIRGEYEDETMKAFQPYADRKTETRFLASGEFLNISSRFQTFERSYFKTLPAEISRELPKIYDRIVEKRTEMNRTRAAALDVVRQIPTINTTQQKLDYFKTVFPEADNKLVAHYSHWLQIYDELEENPEFEKKYSVSILNEFRTILLRYVYNYLHGAITEQQNDQEFNTLVDRIEAERSKREARNVRNLMEQAQERKKELFRLFKAEDLIERLEVLASSNGSIADKVTKYKIEFHELNSRFYDIIRYLLPILFVEEYKDVYIVRYGKNLTQVADTYHNLILKKEIYKMYKVSKMEESTKIELAQLEKQTDAEHGHEKISELLEDLEDSVVLEYGGQFGIRKDSMRELHYVEPWNQDIPVPEQYPGE